MTVLPFLRKSYEAKLYELDLCGLVIKTAGTLDGFVDLAVETQDGSGCTYNLTCDDARRLIAALNGVIEDIQKNCLFDRDPLLETLS